MFLTANQGKNFVKSHGQDTHKFISKQGLDRSFVQCDDHMWRLGRRVLPSGIAWDGGSDWIALSNDFASYITFANNSLLRGLLRVYEYTLLPAESFFHTVLINSEHCDTIVDNNLHATNWKRRQGCKCQYKKIVDWCGCSPNDFKLEDWKKLQTTSEREGIYFARKFEPIIDLLVINKLESWIQDDVTNYKIHGDNSYDKYWENVYDRLDSEVHDESRLVVYQGMTRLTIQFLGTRCKLQYPSATFSKENSLRNNTSTVMEVSVLSENNRFKGLLVTFQLRSYDHSFLTLESWMKPKHKFKLIRRLGPINRLVSMTTCSDFDVKEVMFRNYGCIIGPNASMTLLHEWNVSEDVLDDELLNFSVTFNWLNPRNKTTLSFEESIALETPQDISSSSLLLSSTPNLRQPMMSGFWRVIMMYHDILVAETSFLVIPMTGFEQNNSRPTNITHTQRVLRNKHPNTLSQLHSNILDDDAPRIIPIEAASDMSQSRIEYFADSLIDNMISRFWSVQDVCVLTNQQNERTYSQQERPAEYYSLPHQQRYYHLPPEDNDTSFGREAGVKYPDTKNKAGVKESSGKQQQKQQDHGHRHSLLQQQEEEESLGKESVWMCSQDQDREGNDAFTSPVDAAAESDTRAKLTLQSCSSIAWSSYSPDPKSEII